VYPGKLSGIIFLFCKFMMMPKALLLLCACLSLLYGQSHAQAYTETEAHAAWNALKKKPITEQTFREACDLMQDIGKTHLAISYEMLTDYLP
jgi:hypothetical protein